MTRLEHWWARLIFALAAPYAQYTNAKTPNESNAIAPQASGELVLRAHADDGAGNTAVTSTTAWVAGEDDWWFEQGNADRIDVLPEKKDYEAGDTARAASGKRTDERLAALSTLVNARKIPTSSGN